MLVLANERGEASKVLIQFGLHYSKPTGAAAVVKLLADFLVQVVEEAAWLLPACRIGKFGIGGLLLAVLRVHLAYVLVGGKKRLAIGQSVPEYQLAVRGVQLCRTNYTLGYRGLVRCA